MESGADVVVIESRQPGDPPPSVMLKAPIGGLVSASEVAPWPAGRAGQGAARDHGSCAKSIAVARVPEHLAGKLKAGQLRTSACPRCRSEKFDGDAAALRHGGGQGERHARGASSRLPNPSLTLRPDMRAEFSIVLEQARGRDERAAQLRCKATRSNRFVYVEDFDLQERLCEDAGRGRRR